MPKESKIIMRPFLSIACVLALLGGAANGETVDFNTAGAMDQFRKVHAGDGPGAWKWQSDAGVNGSGGLVAENYAGTSVLVLQKGIERTVSTPIRMSVLFQWHEPVFGIGHGFFVGVGLTPDYLPAVAGQKEKPTAEQLYVGVGRRETPNSARLVGATASQGEMAMYHSHETVELEPGQWYRLRAELTPEGERLRVALQLEKWKAGVEGEVISTFEFLTQPVPVLLKARQWYPFLGSGPNAVHRGVRAVDELTIE